MINHTFLSGAPDNIKSLMEGAEILNIVEGRMKNQIIKISHRDRGECFLNISQGEALTELEGEHILLKNYKDKLPIPKIVAYETTGVNGYLMTTAVEGTPMHLIIDQLDTSKILDILGETLYMISSAQLMPDLRDGLGLELDTISLLMKENKINKYRFEKTTGQVPEKILELLKKEKEEHNTDVLTHGDYCIPNLLIKDGKLSGIIDWGKSGKGDIYRDLSSVEGSLMRNLGVSGLRELFSILRLDTEFYLRKIEYYNKIDQFWYNYIDTL